MARRQISKRPSQLAWNRDQKGRFESIFDVDISVCQIVVPKTLKLNKNDQKANRKKTGGGGGALFSTHSSQSGSTITRRLHSSKNELIFIFWLD